MTRSGLGAGEQPLTRLSRFDGTAFHPVAEGGVDAPYVHVFVHGWQPGYRLQERLLSLTDAVPALPAWDPRLVDATGRTLISDYVGLLQALAGLGEDHAVLWYSWLDESATEADVLLAFRSRQATQINGRRLALALQEALAGPDPRLHLIGHSHGSAVVTHAAVSLGRAPEQLTLLDAPESSISRVSGAADLIHAVLPRLRPGRGRGRTFVDAYATVFGRSYHRRPGLSAVVDVVLVPPLIVSRNPMAAINSAHLYAVDWYARSVREEGRGVGYGWSPLNGADVTQLHSWYRSPLLNQPLALRRRLDLSLVPVLKRLTSKPTRRRELDGLTLELTPRRPAAAAVVHSAPGDFLVEFDLEVLDGDGNEQIEIEVDGVSVFVARPRFPVPLSGRYVMLTDGRPGEHLLTARLTGVRRSGDRRAGDRADRADAGAVSEPRVTVGNVSVINWPGATMSFSLERTASVVFVVGAIVGSLGTVIALVLTGWTARRLLATLSRRRRAR